MTTLELRGVITKDGMLQVTLPDGVPPGEVTVRIDLPVEEDALDIEPPRQRKSREEFVTWLQATPPEEPWGDLADDEDAAEHIHNLRRKRIIELEEPKDE